MEGIGRAFRDDCAPHSIEAIARVAAWAPRRRIRGAALVRSVARARRAAPARQHDARAQSRLSPEHARALCRPRARRQRIVRLMFAEMKRYVRFEAADEEALRALAPSVAPHFRRLADEFYQRIQLHEGAL